MLTKKLVRHGNSLALVIDKPILDLLGITEETEVNVVSDGERLLIEPRRPTRREASRAKQFEAAAKQVMDQYEGMFKRLAQ